MELQDAIQAWMEACTQGAQPHPRPFSCGRGNTAPWQGFLRMPRRMHAQLAQCGKAGKT